MCAEIEAKLKVESHEQIAGRLNELRADFLAEQSHTDCYFDDAGRTLTRSDRCLRLRRLVIGRTQKTLLTYKGAKEKDEFKKRQEVEIEVGSGDSAERLLSVLGYERVLVVEKKRQIWRLGDCEVALDELPLLGRFVEIEGPDGEKIADVREKLGLSGLTHIGDSYASMVAEKFRQEGRSCRQ
jgi:adenylate cyclase class 2